MTIGTALVIVVLLYIIDRRNLWRQAGIVATVLTGLTVLGGAGYWWYGARNGPAVVVTAQQKHKADPLDSFFAPAADPLQQLVANGECEKAAGKGYTAVGVSDEFPHGTACEKR